MRVTCPGCSGSGKIGDNTCTVCYGSGVVDYPDGNTSPQSGEHISSKTGAGERQ